MESVRVGLIGCGMIAQVMHLPHLWELEQFEIGAVCDVSPGLLTATRQRYPGVTTFSDYHEMLDRADIDAVMVLTRVHAEPAIAALKAGKHTFIEKPMCNSPQEADAIIEAAENNQVKLMVGYHKRYDPGYLAGLEQIATADDIRLIRLHDVIGPNDMFLSHYSLPVYHDIPDDIVRETQAKSDASVRDAIGDVPVHVKNAYQLMLGLSVHDLTILRGAFGAPRGVLSTDIWAGGRYFTSVFDYGEDLRCVFDTGVVGHRIFDEELAVFASNKIIRINFPSPFIKNAPTTVDVWEMDGEKAIEKKIISSYEEAFKLELIHFHDCIINDNEPMTSGYEARDDIALLVDMIHKYLSS